MGVNLNQHWVFFFLFAMMFIFSLGVVITQPTTTMAQQGQLVNIAGHQAILITPRLSSTHKPGFIKQSSVKGITGDQPVLVVHPDSLSQLSFVQSGTASMEIPKGTTSAKARSRSSHPFLLFGCVIASALLGAKAGRRIIKSKNGMRGISFVREDSLEDDLAFDIAYTTASSEVGYGSFVSSWAGDLEKFDV